MRKLFKERKLLKGGNYMRKYGNCKYLQPAQDVVSNKHNPRLRFFYVQLIAFKATTHIFRIDLIDWTIQT